MTSTDDLLISRALEPLAGPDLLRGNAYRVTGLSPGASTRDIKRAKEEHLGRFAEPPEGAGLSYLAPSADPDELRAAFALLDDPVARIVHGLLWGGSTPTGFAAVEQLAPMLDPDPSTVTMTHTKAELWGTRLSAWVRRLRDDSASAWIAARAAEIDDPRLTPALLSDMPVACETHLVDVAVRTLQQRLSARASGVEFDAINTYVAAITEAFPGHRRLHSAIQATAEPHVDSIHRALDTASNSHSGAGRNIAKTLLTTAGPDLAALKILLGSEHRTFTRACDNVATLAANRLMEVAAAVLTTRRYSDLHGLAPLMNFAAHTVAASDALRSELADLARKLDQLERDLDPIRGLVTPTVRPPARAYAPITPAHEPADRPPLWIAVALICLLPAALTALAAAIFGFSPLWVLAPLLVGFVVAYATSQEWADSWPGDSVTPRAAAVRLIATAAAVLVMSRLLGIPTDWPSPVAMCAAALIVTFKESY